MEQSQNQAEPSVSYSNKSQINISIPTSQTFSHSNQTVLNMDSKKTFENKAFELEDIRIDDKNPFNRQERPGSMMSVRSNTSGSSRSSVNCATGQIRCPNLRLQRFFAYKSDTGFMKAVQDIKNLILPEKDGQFIGNWLLIEISLWDLHRERVVMLTEKTLFIITYDFINAKLKHYDRVSLEKIKKVKFGNLQYTKGSMMGEYLYGAVKIIWGDENLGIFQKWNPINFNVPFVVFTSHHILYNDKEKETEYYNCDEFIASLEFALSKSKEQNKCEIVEQPIEIESYASMVSVLYNQNWLGFQLDRNGVNF